MQRSSPPTKFRSHGRWTVAEARAVLAAQAASGLSAAAFAVREGLDVQRLHRWRRRVEGERAAPLERPAFVEVRPRRSEPVEIVLLSGRVLGVSESVDTGVLARIAGALDRGEKC